MNDAIDDDTDFEIEIGDVARHIFLEAMVEVMVNEDEDESSGLDGAGRRQASLDQVFCHYVE
jgi:hypothetical protein